LKIPIDEDEFMLYGDDSFGNPGAATLIMNAPLD
jgi:hypothetical protein